MQVHNSISGISLNSLVIVLGIEKKHGARRHQLNLLGLKNSPENHHCTIGRSRNLGRCSKRVTLNLEESQASLGYIQCPKR